MKHFFTLFFLISYGTLIAQVPDGYYTSANGINGTDLKTALYHIIKGHTEYPYTAGTTDVWDILKESDKDPNNSENVILLYTGLSVNAAQEYNSANGWTREHVWAKSRGSFTTDDEGAGTDAHNLRPENSATNTMRSNRWFAECSVEYSYNNVATGSYYSTTDWFWKPRDEVKGDVARMIFYMATRYEGENGEPDLEVIDYIPAEQYTNDPVHAKLSDLLLWHLEDPVDDFERNRNEVVYGYQNNRNPFIDHPEYVNSIWEDYIIIPGMDSPDDLRISVSATGLELNWSDVEGETSYLVYRAEDEVNFDLIVELVAESTSYTDIDATAGLEYWYYILSVNEADTSETLNIVHVDYNLASDLFITEYIEGSSYNKAIEISNYTGYTIDLSNFTIKKQANGAGDWTNGFNLAGTLNYGESFVITNESASAELAGKSDTLTNADELTFNGNDPISLWKAGELIDIIGNFNELVDFAPDVTLIRIASLKEPNTTYTPAEWIVKNQDNFDNIGFHVFGSVADCTTPDDLNYNFLGDNSIRLNWCDCEQAESFYLRYKTTADNNWINVNSSEANYSLFDLAFSTEYEFQIAGVCASGVSNYSASELFTTREDNSSSISTIQNRNAIYPNPASNEIYIKNITKAELEIFSVTGLLMQKTVLLTNKVDISFLSKGIYILRLNNNGNVSYHRLIKK
ncbi:MAG: endonuclease [Bacteroidales bacterium]|nr:endonuclease [Bacteroidales bacterium]